LATASQGTPLAGLIFMNASVHASSWILSQEIFVATMWQKLQSGSVFN